MKRAWVACVICSPNVCDLDVSEMSFGLINCLVDLLIVLDPCTEVFGSFFGVLTMGQLSVELRAQLAEGEKKEPLPYVVWRCGLDVEYVLHDDGLVVAFALNKEVCSPC